AGIAPGVGAAERSERSITRVVVVDDHEMFLESVVRLLGDDRALAVVGTAGTATEGVAVSVAERPDVVILDYQLPDMEAPEAIRALKAAGLESKILILSGSNRPGALFASMRAGSDAWITKSRAVSELR